MKNNYMFIVVEYIKYITLYVVIIPLCIILVQGGNFGGPLLLGFMFIAAPLLSLGIPGKIIRMKNITSAQSKVLLYISHIVLAVGIQIIAVLLLVRGVFGNFSML